MSDTRYRYPLRLDASLEEQVRSRSQINGQTMQDYLEEAVRIHIATDIAAHTDSEIAPIIAKLIHDSQKQHAGTLRKLIARNVLETLRTQHILTLFINKAGVSWGQLTTWRDDAWRWAVRELKTEPDPDAGEEAAEEVAEA